MKRKIIALCLIVAMLGVAVISGTMAYFTDTDEAVNVMTIGSVKIEQHEYERVVKADGTYEMVTSASGEGYKLQEFTQAKPLLPAVGSITGWSTERVYFDQLGKGAYGSQSVFVGLNNVQDKFVLVENTGRSDAYVRSIIAYEIGALSYAEWDALVGLSVGDFWTRNPVGIVEINDNQYYVVENIYAGTADRHVGGILPGGEYTHISLAQIYLSKEATNEDAEALDGNKNGTYDILVLSQAVQASGFGDAKTALDAGFEEVTAAKAAEWFGELDIPVVVSNADELVKALENGEDVVLEDDVKIDPAGMSNAYGTTGINVKNGQTIDGNGNTLDIKGAGGTWDSGINTTGGLIKDITVTGSFRGIFINHNSTHSEPVVLENVTIEGTTYTISCDQGMNQTLTATNSTFKGWTSFAATLGNAKFVDCYFGYGNGYRFCRPYAPTEFVGCEFEAGYTIDPRAAVTFENCTIDGVPLTDVNVADLVTNTTNVTVK
ncbi:MAG: hypothetical protein E7654_09475 [Ruminococcaceae bacterium]|nr:hypothetical protein [Oscillospiraceae bacterium]